MNETTKEAGILRLDEYKAEIDRLKFLFEMDQGNYKDEANILCCVYIDRFSNSYNFPNIKSNHKKFCEILIKYSKISFFGRISFRQLLRNFKKNKSKLEEQKIADKIINYFNSLGCNLNEKMYCINLLPKYTNTYDVDQFLLFCKEPLNLSDKEIAIVKKEQWKGTVASICYEFIRCPTIHEYTANTLNIGDVSLEVHDLYSALENIYTHIRELYEKDGKYFNFKEGDHPFSFSV